MNLSMPWTLSVEVDDYLDKDDITKLYAIVMGWI